MTLTAEDDMPAQKQFILQIDDGTREPVALVAALVRAGYQIRTVAGPRQALQILQRDHPALILVSAAAPASGDEQAWRDLAALLQLGGGRRRARA